jgi:cystathionine beta-synthase
MSAASAAVGLQGEEMPFDLSKVKYANTILDTIGDTPLVKLNKITKGIDATVLAKVEYFNPGGSVKDRIGVNIVADAERRGALKPGGTIIESTSGNTGAGIALVAAIKGYKAVFTMPDKMSKEKIRLLKSYGGEVITCPTAVPPESEESYYSVAKRIAEETPNSILANQYFNPLNPDAHYESTGPEIWEDTGGQLDYFVCGIGTGGTISGVGRYLKKKKPGVKIIGADPEGSILRDFFYTKEMTEARPYLVEGIGEDLVPGTFQQEYVDDIITVGDRESFLMARRLSREEGLLVGGSCGTAMVAALEVARGLDKDKLVVVLLPDTGERYLSKFHSDEWMRENRMLFAEELTVGELLKVKARGLPAVLYVKADDSVQTAVTLMKRHNITQIPVKRGDKWVGKLSEWDLLDQLVAGEVAGDQPVGEVMGESFPLLSPKAHYADALKLFHQRHMAILVVEGDETLGIITKSDVVEHMLSGLD